ncbi:hypothetical protein SLEP1_g22196 [Rubroshorea leprosula]|uniref:Secreted protein n=1 Tax=Rubroshorea leprosula TaxID=152421 RepID=A0AAV5JH97_9ROSI|nr:hypothetical protein SLEP1_g22196 [Rubroshorea leprosula]
MNFIFSALIWLGFTLSSFNFLQFWVNSMSFPCTSRRSPQATAPIFARKFWYVDGSSKPEISSISC